MTGTAVCMDELLTLRSGGLRLSTTWAMSLAACGAALIAVFGEADPTSWITVLFAIVGLAPWALPASGVRLDPWVFVAMTMLPAAPISWRLWP